MSTSVSPNARHLLFAACLVVLVAGCGVRSISNSGLDADSDRGRARATSPFYKGELNELDVLGIDPKSSISEEDIHRSLVSRTRFTIPKGSSILLIQSGTLIPDEGMVKGLEKYYNVSVFTGVPGQGGVAGDGYAKALRLAAAKGGYEKLVVYWGLLETARENLATKAVSWVPIVGGVLPDESQRMRIRMKVLVTDVMSGQWDMFSPDVFDDVDISGRYTRVSSDQGQVAVLKEKAYLATVDDLLKRYAK